MNSESFLSAYNDHTKYIVIDDDQNERETDDRGMINRFMYLLEILGPRKADITSMNCNNTFIEMLYSDECLSFVA